MFTGGMITTASTATPLHASNNEPIGKEQCIYFISRSANNAKDSQSSLSSTIARLSSKTGVVATVVIDSTLGSVIQSSGHYSASRAATAAKNSASTNTARPAAENGLGQLAAGSSDLDELAAMVWKYVKTTEALIADLDSEV